MNDRAENVVRHYATGDIRARILKALEDSGVDLEAVSREDLGKFDHMHFGGLDATREMAALVGLTPGMRVLDVGSGVGGPARTLAAEYGCTVVGLDLTEEYVLAAEMLTEMVGLDDQVSFRQGDALEMPFDDGEFDVVWFQSSMMNIPQKERLIGQTRRVLRPGGLAAVEGAFKGPTPGLYFPIYWASDEQSNDLITPQDFREMMEGAGFSLSAWVDVSGEPQEPDADVSAAEGSSAHILYPNAEERAANYRRSWKEGMVVTVQTVWRNGE
ncbi:MAG: methyltransferase domain-containing protein [Anaerolineae bacterium]|nr:methyltransferase domain-containing protein [Anaerolineae bacterium]